MDVDLQLALLRSGAHPVARSAVGLWLGLLVALAIVAELAFSFLHGVALVLVALVFAVSAAGMVRAFWLRARTALGDR